MEQTTLRIGMIGPPALLRQNRLRLQTIPKTAEQYKTLHIIAAPLYHARQIALLDGLLITGWQEDAIQRPLYPLRHTLANYRDTISFWGIAYGAAMLGENGILPIIDCEINAQPGSALTTAILEFPAERPKRFVATFLPTVHFSSPAPNLAILCENDAREIVAVRQGNHMVCSFIAEWTRQDFFYCYWLEMLLRQKEERQ